MYWQRFDPHARAYATLESKHSRSIMRNLRRPASSGQVKGERDELCLSCHVRQDYDIVAQGRGFSPSDGVGCESCHGASQFWGTSHYQVGWDGLRVEQKASIGFSPLDSLADEARSCMPCHVGSASEDSNHDLVDVNHDLIAAGHPRLNFEFASYYAMYPKHWSDRGDWNAEATHEAKAWIVGQLAGAGASLRLLKARAGRSDTPTINSIPRALRSSSDLGPQIGPWPEFAEYNCYACHHDLQGGAPLPRGSSSAESGQISWGNWYTAMPTAIAQEFPPPGRDWPGLLSSIEHEMNQPLPDADLVVELTDESIEVIETWLDDIQGKSLDLKTIDRLVAAVIDHLLTSPNPSWDRNAQAYLASVTLVAAQADLEPNRKDPQTFDNLEAVFDRLRFREGSSSPPFGRFEELNEVFSAIRNRAITGEQPRASAH
ncbi:multiheme c-type cytochrome [Tautonia plasticadhaerens]|nr:multiheme c-type cytochrome [Tautonia plasticadhaerens]